MSFPGNGNGGGSVGWKAATAISAAVATGSLATLIWSKVKRRKDGTPEKWMRVGNVSELLIYPIKSCHGTAVLEAVATRVGLKVSDYFRDRVFMVVDSKGELQRMTEFPKMTLIKTSFNANEISLSAPEMEDITVAIPEDSPGIRRTCSLWGETVKVALDCGPEVSEWLSKYVGKKVFLCYHPGEDTQRLKLTSSQKRFWTFSAKDKGTFQDETSYMFTTEESLNELNKKLEVPVTQANFRPVVVLQGIPEPFAEEKWAFVKIGENGPVFKAAQPCLRCKLTTIDPETGVYNKKGEPLRTLHRMKRKLWNEEMDEVCKTSAVFGIHFGLNQEGEAIKKGDPVYAAVV